MKIRNKTQLIEANLPYIWRKLPITLYLHSVNSFPRNSDAFAKLHECYRFSAAFSRIERSCYPFRSILTAKLLTARFRFTRSLFTEMHDPRTWIRSLYICVPDWSQKEMRLLKFCELATVYAECKIYPVILNNMKLKRKKCCNFFAAHRTCNEAPTIS